MGRSYAGRVSIRLRFLGEVSFDGTPITGTRPADLLAALALHPAGLSDAALVDEVWADEPPAASAKALQVLVSRLRSHAGPDLLHRHDGRYRLALAGDEVDAWYVDELAGRARQALSSGDPETAEALVAEVLALLGPVGPGPRLGPLGDLRARAVAHEDGLRRTHALALARRGLDAAAVPLLAQVHAAEPDNVEVMTELLRGEARVAGAPVALTRYEHYRHDLADRLGVDPDPALQQVHRELLAADRPVRRGVQFDADQLLGREEDLLRLRVMVRTGRLTTILGPGGLGKTRVAHVLAREATQPRVHFIELVGISNPADVVSEVGSALGVRDSVTGRRGLTAAQLSDVRGRIAQELDTVPTLLVLDNCEHILDAVASLVAFLLVSTRDLRIVTTSRAPLGIAAERVLGLKQLDLADGTALFLRRARAARPEAVLPADVVADVVRRLDGLPLAIELAAARVRAMSAEELLRRLDDRFALLRGRDRTVHARHQTLTAVIGWSWDLLSSREQRALAWLSVFQDGFTSGSAELVVGPDATDLVEALADQSLLVLTENDGHLRYRMLETVREYAGQRLAEAGETEQARAAQDGWAADLAVRWQDDIWGSRQFDAIDVLWEEESNLADVLRRALSEGDSELAVLLLAVLGAVWTITGNHGRVMAFADPAEALLTEFDPPPELVEPTASALSLLLTYVRFMRPVGDDDPLPDRLTRLGEPRQPWSRVVAAMVSEPPRPGGALEAVLGLAEHPDPATRLMALQWAAVLTENAGAIAEASDHVCRALAAVDDSTTPWQLASLHGQSAQLALQRGDYRQAAEHARAADPVLTRLKAVDDALHARAAVAVAALSEGDLEGAQKVVAQFDDLPPGSPIDAGTMTIAARAELQLARGDIEAGLATYDECVAAMRAVSFAGVESTGLEPWVIMAEGAALAAYVRHAGSERQRLRADELARGVHRSLCDLASGVTHMADYPVTGMGVVALGAYAVTHELGEPGVRLLALAHRYGYNRSFPALSWAWFAELAERTVPGRLEVLLAENDGAPGPDLLAELAAALEDLTGLTSCW